MESIQEHQKPRRTGTEMQGQEIMSSFNIDTSGAGTAGTNLIESVTSGITAKRRKRPGGGTERRPGDHELL